MDKRLGEGRPPVGPAVSDDVQRVQALVEAAADVAKLGAYTVDLEEGRVTCDSRYFTMLGYNPEDVSAHPGEISIPWWRDRVHPDDWPAVQASFFGSEEAARQGAEIEYRMRHRDGTWRWILDRCKPFGVSEHGRPARVVGVHMDITERRAAADELRASEERFRRFAQEIQDVAIQGIDEQRRVIFWNRASERLYGYSNDEARGRRLEELVLPPQLHAAAAAEMSAWFQDGPPGTPQEYVLLRRDGQLVHVLSSQVLLPQASGRKELYSADVDITRLRDTEHLLHQHTLAVDNAQEAVFMTDREGAITSVNRAFTAITGYEAADVMGKNPRVLQSGRHDAAFYDKLWTQLLAEGRWQGEIWNRRKDGEVFPAWSTIARTHDSRRRYDTHFVCVFSDVTAIKRSQEQVDFLAFHDPLTRLPNRLLLRERLDHAITRARQAGRHLALVYVDIDHFRVVNDSRGHAAGDLLLQAVAERLQGLVDPSDTVARATGDEFVVLLEDRDAHAIAGWTQDLLAALREPFHLEPSTPHYTSASVGVALYPSDADDTDALLLNANLAMHRVKKQGRNGVSFFAPGLADDVRRRAALTNALRDAVTRGAFTLAFQAQWDLATRAIVGVEALARWRDDALGDIPPDVFIPLAEELGLVREIGRLVLHQALEHMARWRRARIAPQTLAINLSIKQLERPGLIEEVDAALITTGVPPGCVELEVTESVVAEQEALVISRLRALSERGLKLSLDDFGTGYSSLAFLSRFPFSKLKIDRSFVAPLAEAREQAIVRAMIQLGHTLGMTVLAEGIEHDTELHFLAQEGCDVGQGFLFNRPIGAREMTALLEREAQARRSN